MRSTAIGIREAKAQLSRLVADAQRGAEWIITDRGRPVAKLSPLSESDRPIQQRIATLEAWGWIGPARTRPARIPPPARVSADAQAALQEDRGS